MSIMRRAILPLVGITAVTVISPQLGWGLDRHGNGAFELAMGPVSAPLKVGGPPAAPDTVVTTCPADNPSCGTPHRHPRHRHRAAAR